MRQGGAEYAEHTGSLQMQNMIMTDRFDRASFDIQNKLGE